MNKNKISIRAENNFNILRFLFASLVILSHAPEIQDGDRRNELLTRAFGTLSFGELAVDSFFLLSGFLIVKSWTENPNIIQFLKNRILRIYPAFIASSIICAALFAPIGAQPDYFEKFRIYDFISGLVYLSPPQIPDVFKGTHYPSINGSMWTIYPEFNCYLIALVFGALGGFRLRFAWLALCVGLIILYSADSEYHGQSNSNVMETPV